MTQTIFIFPSKGPIPKIQLIKNQEHTMLYCGEKQTILTAQSDIRCTYHKEGWGPIVDYVLQLSVAFGERPPIFLIQLHSADEDLEDAWNYLQESLPKIATHITCTLTLEHF